MSSIILADPQSSPQLFRGYTDADTTIFAEFVNPNARPEAGFIVDFLGSRIRTASLWEAARALDGKLLDIPVPGDFHAEAIEWIGLLKAVRSAQDTYVAMELGAGFGPWVVAGAIAARLRGNLESRLYAVEGDPDHFKSLRQHFHDNGFDPDQHALFEAVVGVDRGVAQWPISPDSSASEDWGVRPIQADRDYRGIHFRDTKSVQIIPILDLIVKEPRWDLIHIDVQGDELRLCQSCIAELSSRVRWMIIATHSRKVEGGLLELMCNAGWLLDHEKPAKFAFTPNAASMEAMTTVDGTQVWRNPGLIAAEDSLACFSQEISSAIGDFRAGAGETRVLKIETKNTGSRSWFGPPAQLPVVAGYRWLDSNASLLAVEGNRSQLNVPVLRPGESDRLRLEIVMPPSPGEYTLLISMVQEGMCWFYIKGSKALSLQVTVD